MSKDMKLVARVSSRVLTDGHIRVLPISGKGSVNKVFIVEAPNTKLVVRIRDQEESLKEYTKEVWCIDKAAARGIPVPTVLDVGLIEEHAYMIQAYISGDEGRNSQFPRSHIWRQLGRYTKLIHSIEVAGFGLELPDLTEGDSQESWLEYLNYNIESLNENDELIKLKVVTQSQSRVIRAMFEDLKRKAFNFGLNHGDLSLKNVIVDESGKVSLLDWGSAEASIVPHHDLIQMLKMNILENDPDGAAFQSFLEGYGISQSEFEQMRPTLESLLLLRAFDKLRWAIDRGIVALERFIIHARQAVERNLTTSGLVDLESPL
jgi:aminoglycoside phosphotransferase (APT) family kinase protein